MAKLYVVGTPIGNLGDISPRAVEILREADFIAAEDTRVTMKLLNHFAIKKPMVSYYEHNLREKGQIIVSRILAGEICAVVSDAGMPCISDPGEDLVRLCAEQGVEVVTVPGPSAMVAALAVSGLSTARFTFEGFLSVNRASRRQRLESLFREQRTMVFYEAPHKLTTTLADLEEAFGPQRRISLCRELTKLHEEVLRTTIAGAREHFAAVPPRGEFVLVVEGAPADEAAPPATPEEALAVARGLVDAGRRPTDAAKEAARLSGVKKSDIYRLLTMDGE